MPPKDDNKPKQTSRFYKEKFPEAEDFVMVNVKSIEEMGAYVELLEYQGCEGMILLSELSRRRIRSINKLIRVGQTECVVVLRVDQTKGYIDLSKRRVAEEDKQKCLDRYNQAKIVNQILRSVADETDYNLEDLYEKTAWKVEEGKPLGSSYTTFKKAIVETPEMFDEFDLPEEVKSKLVAKVQQKLMPQAVKIRAVIDVKCYSYEGIDAIKSSLKAGLQVSSDDFPIQINLISPPLYKIETSALNKVKGIEVLTECIDLIEEELTKRGGIMEVKLKPKVEAQEHETPIEEEED
eukprot:m.135129 g.135129  ORF g.135129 m.135129 type:complete len:294 (-) comp9848_c0_seq1:153-1034(-)